METPEITSLIRIHGLRQTKFRQALLIIFQKHPTPLSVPFLRGILARQGIRVNKSTIYREISTLLAVRLIQKVSLSDRKQYFEVAERDHHHHLICLGCEQVEEIDVDERSLRREETKVSREKHFAILRHSLEFYGHCARCLSVPA